MIINMASTVLNAEIISDPFKNQLQPISPTYSISSQYTILSYLFLLFQTVPPEDYYFAKVEGKMQRWTQPSLCLPADQKNYH